MFRRSRDLGAHNGCKQKERYLNMSEYIPQKLKGYTEYKKKAVTSREHDLRDDKGAKVIVGVGQTAALANVVCSP